MTQDRPMPDLTLKGPLDTRVPPPILAVIVAILMVVVSRATPSMPLPAALRIAACGACMLFAGYMGARAFAAFRRARTTINPVNIAAASALVTTGVYQLSRNPMYVALTTLLLALAFGLSSGIAFAGPVLFAVFIQRFQIAPEERVMLAKFGEAYAAYTRRVRRWL